MTKLTLATLRTHCQRLGLSVRKFDGEYRVNYRGADECSAYYTDDINDAYDTATRMSETDRAVDVFVRELRNECYANA